MVDNFFQQVDRKIEDLYYSDSYETVIERVNPIWLAEIEADEPSLQAWISITYEVRCCYQLERPLTIGNSESPLTKFARAYLDFLNKINLADTLECLSELSQRFNHILSLRAVGLRCKFEKEKSQARKFIGDSEQLVREFDYAADALEILMHNYLTIDDNLKAFEIGNRYLNALQQNNHSPLRYFEEKVRVSAFQIALGKFVETEKVLAELLAQKTHVTSRGRALTYFFLANIAQRLAGNTESKQKDFRQYSQEAAHRFFELARSENEKGRGKVVKILNKTIQNFFDSEFDFSTSVPRYKAVLPEAAEDNPTKWIDYGLAMAREGNAPEASKAYLKAYNLSVEQGNSKEGIKAIHHLLPEHSSLFNRDEIAAIFQAWQDKFGTFDRSKLEAVWELRRIRVLALQDIVNEQYKSGAKLLGNFLFEEHFLLDNIPQDEILDTFYRLGFDSYWAGLYETAAKAWDNCYERLSEDSLREQIKNLLQLDKTRRFSKYAGNKQQSQSKTLNESFTQLEQALKTFAISQDVRALWLQVTDMSAQLSKAQSYQLKNLAVSQYQTFERAYKKIKDSMANSEEFVPFAAGVAKIAARVEFIEAYSGWGKFWRDIIHYLRERASSSSFKERVLSFDTEREISKFIGDCEHETRSAARAVKVFLEAGNPDIAGYCMEMMHSLHRSGRFMDAAIMANLGIESLKFTRRRMQQKVSREEFFIERFFIYHQALEFIETCLKDSGKEVTIFVTYLLACEFIKKRLCRLGTLLLQDLRLRKLEFFSETINFFASVYWNISEGFKARYFFDKPLIVDNRLKQEIQNEYERDEEQFFKFALTFMEHYANSDDKSFPSFESVWRKVQSVLQENSNSSNQTNAELPLQYQLQIKGFSIFDAQESLPDKTALLVIVAHPRLEDEYGGILLVTKEQVKFAPLAVFRYEQDIVQPMYESWGKKFNQNSELDNSDRSYSRLGFLYRALIPAFEQDLEKIEHLIISPSGSFNNVPFPALWDEQNKQHLIEKLGITVVPSGQLIPIFSQDKAVLNKQQALLLLALCPDGSPKIPENQVNKLPRQIKYKLENLQSFELYAKKEYDAIDKRWQGKLKVISSKSINIESAELLTKTKLLNFMPSANVVYLSMHGIFSYSNPFDTSLLLVPGDNQEADFIYPEDIAALDLRKTYLVMLNSCQVGQSFAPHSNVEELWLSRLGEFTGFPRAFLEAGVHSIIGATNDVPAVATGAFADSFSSKLNENIPLWKALAQTLREFIKGEKGFEEFKHPQYWGFYLLLGAWK